MLLSASISWALQPTLDGLRLPEQGGAVRSSFQLSGQGPWPAGLVSYPGSAGKAIWACASVGGQPAPTCTLHALTLSSHHSQGGCLYPL